MKSRNLNFLEPSGPLQACNGTAFNIYIYIYIYGGIVHYVTCVSLLLLLLFSFIFYVFIEEINDMQENSSDMVTTVFTV